MFCRLWSPTRRMVTGVTQWGRRAIHEVERAPFSHLQDKGMWWSWGLSSPGGSLGGPGSHHRTQGSLCCSHHIHEADPLALQGHQVRPP